MPTIALRASEQNVRLDLKRWKNAKLPTRWDLGNEVLYRLCEEYPRHINEDEILAKIWLVGRSYSAAIERRRESREVSGEAFYTSVVGPKMRLANIDKWLAPLSRHLRPTIENCVDLIDAHKRLTDLFHKITGLEKRSLASKYLHFHFRNLFYIYDSRAAQNLANLAPRSKDRPAFRKFDQVYATHFVRSLKFVESIERDHGIYLSPRKLDDYLLGLI
jgi:hypothetical protein